MYLFTDFVSKPLLILIWSDIIVICKNGKNSSSNCIFSVGYFENVAKKMGNLRMDMIFFLELRPAHKKTALENIVCPMNILRKLKSLLWFDGITA